MKDDCFIMTGIIIVSSLSREIWERVEIAKYCSVRNSLSNMDWIIRWAHIFCSRIQRN